MGNDISKERERKATIGRSSSLRIDRAAFLEARGLHCAVGLCIQEVERSREGTNTS